MKRWIGALILVLCGWHLAAVGHAPADVQSNKEERLVKADSIDQLIDLIKSALQEKNSKRLEQIKNMNIQLVRENQFLATEGCGKCLKGFVSNELSGNIAASRGDIRIAQILAEIYKDATNSSYLLDKVSIFRKWTKKEKEKYLEANKLFSNGQKSLGNYKYDAAKESYYKSLHLFNEIGYKEGEANCLMGIGNVHGRLSENEKAWQKFEYSLAIFREIKNRKGEANCLQRLGNIYYVLNEYEKAQQIYEDGLVIFREIKDRKGEASCLKFLGDVFTILSEYENARQMYELGVVICKEIKDSSIEAACLSGLGDIYYMLDGYEKARHMYERSLKIYQDLKLLLEEAICLKNIGNIHYYYSKYTKARHYFKQAIQIFRKINDRQGEAICLEKLGNVHLYLFEYEKARYMYNESLVIYRGIKDRLHEANCLTKIGEVHRLLGEFKNARQKYEESLIIFRELKSRIGEAACLSSLGEIYRMLSEYRKAMQLLEEGLAIFRDINDRNGEAFSLQSLGVLHLNLFEYKKAIRRFGEGLVIFRDLKNNLGMANSLVCLGDAYMGLSEFENARQYYESAISIQKQIKERRGLISSYIGMGKAFESIKLYHKSEENFQNSIQIVEEAWQLMKIEEYKTDLIASMVFAYEELIQFYFKQGKGSAAFPYAERSKARSFLYLLGNKRIDPSIGVPPELAQEEKGLRQKINSMSERILENEEKEATQRVSTEKWNEQLLELKQKHSEVLGKIKLNSPEYATLLTVNPLSLEEIQALIREDKNMVLIEYYITPDNTFMWLLDGKKILPYKIDITQKTLDAKIQEFNSIISNSGAGVNTISRRAQRLYDFLLKPVQKYLERKSRVAIVPHGSLHYLPFEALMHKGKFLAEKNIKIFYLPNASVYKYCRQKNKKGKEKVTAFVNPDGTLPGSEKEAAALKELFPGVAVFSGKEVTESLVKANSGSADILHFACHNNFDSKHPLYSGLLLAPDNDNDGRLEVSEIFQLRLKPAYLVTLSACETNVGDISPGDEIIGLTRAFIYAGTPSILASLWKVDDLSTAKLMASFYRELKNADKIDALHTARLEVINEPGKRHPFYWAAFVLIGDPR